MGAAGAVKNEWGQGTCLTTPVAGALRSPMVWGGNGWRGACLRCGKGGGMSCGRSGHWDRVVAKVFARRQLILSACARY